MAQLEDQFTINDPFKYIGSNLIDYDNDEIWEHKPVDIQEFIESKSYCNLKWNGRKGCRPKIMEIAWKLADPKVREAILLLGKGCVAGDTKIAMARGQQFTIEELYEDDGRYEFCVIDSETKKICTIYGTVKFMGEKELYEVTTVNGKVLKCTENHKLCTYFGKKHLRDLKVGDSVNVSSNLNGRNSDQVLQTDSYKLSGYLCTEYFVEFDDTITFYDINNTYKNVIDIVKKYDDTVKYKIKNINKKKTVVFDKIIGHEFTDGSYELSYHKIPPYIFNGSDKNIQEFLSSYLSVMSKVHKRNTTYYFMLNLLDREMIDDIAHLLRIVGIQCRIVKNRCIHLFNNRAHYQLKITDYENLDKLFNTIELTGFNKRKWNTSKITVSKNAKNCPYNYYPEDISQHLDANNKNKKIRKTENNDINYEEIVSIEKLDIQKVYDITIDTNEEKYKNYIANGINISNSGKDFLAALMHSYGIYRCLCMYSPQSYYGLSPGSQIAFINIAVNEDQARNVFFKEFVGMIRNNAWMTGKYNDPGELKINFAKGLVALSGNSRAQSSYGYHTLQCVLDELAFFLDKAKSNPDALSRAAECWDAMYGSCKSRFPLDYKIIGITTPNQEDDFCMKKFWELKGRKDGYVRQAATWDINPATPIESFAEDLKRRKRQTMRDFGAQPVGVLESFWADPYYLEKNVCETCKQCPIYQKRKESPDDYGCFEYENCLANGYKGNGEYRDWFQGDSEIDYFMHIDLAKNGDRVGFTISHIEGMKMIKLTASDAVQSGLVDDIVMGEDYGEEERPIIKIDAVGFIDTTEMNNRMLKKGEFHFDSILKYIIYPLKERKINLSLITFDQWQSLHVRQSLEDQGYTTDLISLDRKMKDELVPVVAKDTITSERVVYPFNLLLCNEAKNLQLINGTKVDHTSKTSKDLWDSFAAAIYIAGKNALTKISFSFFDLE